LAVPRDAKVSTVEALGSANSNYPFTHLDLLGVLMTISGIEASPSRRCSTSGLSGLSKCTDSSRVNRVQTDS